VPRLMYISRTMNPDLVTPHLCEPFDAQVREALQPILQCDLSRLSTESEVLLHLPPAAGGAGITTTSFIARDAFHASLRHAKGALSACNQHSLVKARNLTLATHVDSLGTTEKAHRHACSQKHSFAAYGVPHLRFPSDHFSAALRWRLAIFDSDVIAPCSVCPGCMRQYAPRDYHEHKVGCARLSTANATTVHTAMNRGLQSLCVRAGLSFKHEPRHYEDYVAPGACDDDEGGKGHQQGPDLLVGFPQPRTFDLKGTNGAARSYLRQKYVAIETRKAEASRALYERHCTAKGEVFEVIHFHSGGRLCEEFVNLVKRICSTRPLHLHVPTELARMAVELQNAIGHLLMVHGRPVMVDADGKCVVAPHRARSRRGRGKGPRDTAAGAPGTC